MNQELKTALERLILAYPEYGTSYFAEEAFAHCGMTQSHHYRLTIVRDTTEAFGGTGATIDDAMAGLAEDIKAKTAAKIRDATLKLVAQGYKITPPTP